VNHTPEDEVTGMREVLDSYPPDVQEHLIETLPPQLRGWWTDREVAEHPDRHWVQVTPGRYILAWLP
jgi:hypothetical protein